MDFIAQILAKLDTSQAESQLKTLTKDQTVNLKVQLTGDTDVTKILSKLDSSFASAGQDAGKSYSKGVQAGLKSYKFNGNDFLERYIDRQKKDIKESKSVAKEYQTTNQIALKAVRARNSEETKLKKQQQKEIDAIENARLKSIENSRKREEKLTLNQNKAINKSLENDYKQQQKKQQKINEQNIAQTRANEESKKRIQAQQRIAELQNDAIQKNAHTNELVQQGKDNIAKWKQQYNEKQKDVDGLALVEAYKQASEYQQKESEYLKLRNQYIAEGKKQEQEYYSKKNQSFSQLDAATASNKTLAWLKSNTKAVKDYGDILTDLAHKQRLATNPDDLKKYTKQVNAIKAEAKFLGKTGRSFGDEIVRGFKQISQFTYTYGIIQQIPNAIAQSVSELKQMDDILTEISKTSNLTTSQLKELGSTSFDSASKYGKKASDYLTGIQEMSRSGYYGEQAKQMANLSVLAQAAGDLDANMANSYLLASNAAYQYQGNVEKLNALLDGQNMINRMVMPCRKLMAS